MEVRTHRSIDPRFSGAVVSLETGRARVALDTTSDLAADEHELVHGGFVFSLADHAAMLAINEPTVVLGSADVRFLRPVRVGETVVADAELAPDSGKKKIVAVTVRRGDDPVLTGTFTCFVPPQHVLAAT